MTKQRLWVLLFFLFFGNFTVFALNDFTRLAALYGVLMVGWAYYSWDNAWVTASPEEEDIEYDINEAILSQEDLDELATSGCGNPDCTEEHSQDGVLLLTPPCHPDGQIQVTYPANSGLLSLSCGVCSRLICRININKEKENVSE